MNWHVCPPVDLLLNDSTHTLGSILDGILRNTPEARDFVLIAKDQGVEAAFTMRDSPFNDYSQTAKEQQPRKKSELGL